MTQGGESVKPEWEDHRGEKAHAGKGKEKKKGETDLILRNSKCVAKDKPLKQHAFRWLGHSRGKKRVHRARGGERVRKSK